jgi:hypothetical protein
MYRNKCPGCGLVNVATAHSCSRCGASLKSGARTKVGPDAEQVKKRGIGRRLIWILSATLLLLFASYMSLLITSDHLGFDQRQTVQKAIAILGQKSFTREAFVLTHLTTYRETDNWWNKYVGHHDAYAATNFPFEVVTLYPEFFADAVDDNERAVILLHEAYHLFGSGEETALEKTWRQKGRLDWTADKYAQSRVWKNTRELTLNRVPALFQCGPDGRSDCIK